MPVSEILLLILSFNLLLCIHMFFFYLKGDKLEFNFSIKLMVSPVENGTAN